MVTWLLVPGRLVTRLLIPRGLVTWLLVPRGLVTRLLVPRGLVTWFLVPRGLVTWLLVPCGLVTRLLLPPARNGIWAAVAARRPISRLARPPRRRKAGQEPLEPAEPLAEPAREGAPEPGPRWRRPRQVAGRPRRPPVALVPPRHPRRVGVPGVQFNGHLFVPEPVPSHV